MTTLETLWLENNRLTALPASMAKMTSLQMLNLSGNRLKAVPTWIGSLTGLQTLNLAKNQLTGLPSQIQELKLRHLYLHENGALGLTDEIVHAHADVPSILDYFFRLFPSGSKK